REPELLGSLRVRPGAIALGRYGLEARRRLAFEGLLQLEILDRLQPFLDQAGVLDDVAPALWGQLIDIKHFRDLPECSVGRQAYQVQTKAVHFGAGSVASNNA